MITNTYEYHKFDNIDLPVIFHSDKVKKNYHLMFSHWHENIELLFITKGKVEVQLDDNVIYASPNDIVVINSSVIHNVTANSEQGEYECLIIDKNFCEQHGFYIDENHIHEIVKDEKIYSIVLDIKNNIVNRPQYYTEEILSDVIKILIGLFRNHIDGSSFYSPNKNIEMVKKGIKYIKKHFKEQLSIDEIADYAGYSKYYFCRCFKDITGQTINGYINQIKINYAYKQLSQTNTSVSDIAEQCGFNDISYFTKIFKKYANVLPSKVEKHSTGSN